MKMKDTTKDEIKNLINNRVWVTKKARMEAEARMNRNNFFMTLLVNYYTFIVLAFSIWTLVSENNNMSLLTVIASVGLFGISIFVSAVGYREKALQFKESYLSLNELEFDLKYLLRNENLEESLVINDLKLYEKKYNEILTKSENHNDLDFTKVLIKHDMKINSMDLLYYYIHRSAILICGFTLVVLPIIFTVIYLRG
jgi:SMODS and SLOG-associating 2TM effector domain family 5